jgi:DNA-binding HxlR family transcriptional regulator
MRVTSVRDAIILNMLKSGNKSFGEIESLLGIQKSITSRSLSILKESGFIKRQRASGKEIYILTERGSNAIQKIYEKLSL